MWTSQFTVVLMIQPHANSSLSVSLHTQKWAYHTPSGNRLWIVRGGNSGALKSKIQMSPSLGSQTPLEPERHRGKLSKSEGKCWFKETFRFYLESDRLMTVYNFMSFHTWLYNLVRITKMAQENVIWIGTIQKWEQTKSLNFIFYTP